VRGHANLNQHTIINIELLGFSLALIAALTGHEKDGIVPRIPFLAVILMIIRGHAAFHQFPKNHCTPSLVVSIILQFGLASMFYVLACSGQNREPVHVFGKIGLYFHISTTDQ
jgi:hypothetical protein